MLAEPQAAENEHERERYGDNYRQHAHYPLRYALLRLQGYELSSLHLRSRYVDRANTSTHWFALSFRSPVPRTSRSAARTPLYCGWCFLQCTPWTSSRRARSPPTSAGGQKRKRCTTRPLSPGTRYIPAFVRDRTGLPEHAPTQPSQNP